MSKRILIGIGITMVVIVIGIAAYVLRPTAEASAPIEAIPLDEEMVEPQVEEMSPTEADEPAAPVESAAEVDPPAGIVVFSIVPQESQVRFSLDELLRGVPTTVVGTTDQVAGEIAIGFDDPGSAQVGTILVNARTLVTDNNFRNRAINNEILDTGSYEFVSFTPSGILGFPQNPQFGERLSFQIVGELTIRDVTQEVTFDATATAESESRISGYARATILRADYDLNIPEVPSVANVDEEVLLEVEFVAVEK
jgi:polyisoprenoid-binding protein YceI